MLAKSAGVLHTHTLSLSLSQFSHFPNPFPFLRVPLPTRVLFAPHADQPPFLTHPSVSVCGSSPLLAELEETACPQPTELQPQIFSYAETVSFSSDHGAGHSANNSFTADDDALIIDALGDVLFGDETSETFANFTAPFAVEVGAHGKDEEEADGQSVSLKGPPVPRSFSDFDHNDPPRVTVVEDTDLKKDQGAVATVPNDAALIDHFVAEFLDPCFADQAKAISLSVPAYVPASIPSGGGVGGAAEEREPLKTTRTDAVASFGRGRSGLRVPMAPSVPQTLSSTFPSLPSIPVPVVPVAVLGSSSFTSYVNAPQTRHFAVGLRPSDFKSKKEYRRMVAIPRYLAKRKRRQWNKPMYSTRTEAAYRRIRANGKFSRSETFVSVSELKK